MGENSANLVTLFASRNSDESKSQKTPLIPPQGCQIFLGTKYQNRENIPNQHKIFQISTKYTKWPLNISNSH
jgi:hypothetical protein